MKLFAGGLKDSPIGLVESLAMRGLLETEETPLEKVVDFCAEHIANDLSDEAATWSDDYGSPQETGEDWEYNNWTIEWEGTVCFSNYNSPATYDSPAESESIMTSCNLTRAVAWQGEDGPEVDVKAQLQAALKPYLEANVKYLRRGR